MRDRPISLVELSSMWTWIVQVAMKLLMMPIGIMNIVLITSLHALLMMTTYWFTCIIILTAWTIVIVIDGIKYHPSMTTGCRSLLASCWILLLDHLFSIGSMRTKRRSSCRSIRIYAVTSLCFIIAFKTMILPATFTYVFIIFTLILIESLLF